MNKKIFLSLLIACTATVGVNAQQQGGKELNKEITLEKDFVPVEKKVTKKNTLPKVKKVNPPAKTDIDYSATPVNIEVPTTIPTMMPYGYRTAHNFSDKRGYLEVAGGMQANFDGSAGYRFLDKENTQAGIWVQHNSSWCGLNTTKMLKDNPDLRLKQKFNDNKVGLYLNNHFNAGTLSLGVGVHFDSFNYYGAYAISSGDTDKKQSLLEFNVNAGWKGRKTFGDYELAYRANAGFNHAGNSMFPTLVVTGAKGASENVVNFGVGADMALGVGSVSLDVMGDYVNFKQATDVAGWELAPSRSNFYLTLAPRYKWENEIFRAEVGADLLFGNLNILSWNGNDDTGKFHVAPVVKMDVDIVDGAKIFVDLKGGKTLNTLSNMAALDRYSTPSGLGFNTWRAIDGEAGFKVGPFSGFEAKLFFGYAITKGALMNCYSSFARELGKESVDADFHYGPNFYGAMNTRGFKVGAELFYKYRSLFEVGGAVTFAPTTDNSFDLTGGQKWFKTYSLGLDNAGLVANLELKVTPITPLAVNVGMDYRGKRKYIEAGLKYMDDAFDLHVGASWRFDKVVTVWARGYNLLNRKYDILPGQGAQGIGAMAGVSLVF